MTCKIYGRLTLCGQHPLLVTHLNCDAQFETGPFPSNQRVYRLRTCCVHAFRATIEETYNKLQTDIQTEIVDHKEKMNSLVSLKEEKEKESDVMLRTVRQWLTSTALSIYCIVCKVDSRNLRLREEHCDFKSKVSVFW